MVDISEVWIVEKISNVTHLNFKNIVDTNKFSFPHQVDYFRYRASGDKRFEFVRRKSSKMPVKKIFDVDYADYIGLLESQITRAWHYLTASKKKLSELDLKLTLQRTSLCVTTFQRTLCNLKFMNKEGKILQMENLYLCNLRPTSSERH